MINLEDIQSTILKGHGRKYVLLVFIKFTNSGEQTKTWIKNYIYPKVTSVAKQCKDSSIRKFYDINHDGGLIFNFFLASKGYDQIKIEKKNKPRDSSFRAGMQDESIRKKLRDPDLSAYYTESKGNPEPYIENHAMILIANNDLTEINSLEKDIQSSLDNTGIIKNIELGIIKRNDKNKIVDHLGFVDGISNPCFFNSDGTVNKKLLQIVLHKEINGRFGSFLVYRRLSQNIKKSKKKFREVAEMINPKAPESAIDYVKAQLIGRFPDGTPLTVSNTPKESLSDFNDFDYKNDSYGAKCPFHAHIRKANPRSDIGGSEFARITRRGITYDYNNHKLKCKKGVGLLFLCFQNSIESQFEKIQEKWLNSPEDPITSTLNTNKSAGIDPLAGNVIYPYNSEKNQHWNKEWDNLPSKKVKFQIKNMVELKGGEYFYAPSISFLADFQVPYESI